MSASVAGPHPNTSDDPTDPACFRSSIGVSRSTLIAISLSFAACGGGADFAEEGGVPTWVVEGPEVRIGAVDDSEYAFGRVRALAVGADGVLYSLHPQEVEIRR